MDLYRLKLVHKHFNTGKLYDDCPLETSTELTNTEDKPIGLIEQLYYNGKTKKIDKNEESINDGRYGFNVGKLRWQR